MVTFGYCLLKVATSSFHSLSSAFLAAGGMQSMVSVTLAFGSSGAAGSDDDPPPALSSLSALLLVPQAVRATRASAETSVAAEARRAGRNQELLIGSPSGMSVEAPGYAQRGRRTLKHSPQMSARCRAVFAKD